MNHQKYFFVMVTADEEKQGCEIWQFEML